MEFFKGKKYPRSMGLSQCKLFIVNAWGNMGTSLFKVGEVFVGQKK